MSKNLRNKGIKDSPVLKVKENIKILITLLVLNSATNNARTPIISIVVIEMFFVININRNKLRKFLNYIGGVLCFLKNLLQQ
jgi:hypothetical protein